MAILIDPPAWPAHGTLWSHLITDSDLAELHDFAFRLGLPRRSFDLDHYDVPASLHARAVALGARAVGAKDIVHRLRAAGLRVRQAEREAMYPVRRRQYLEAEWARLGDTIGIGVSAQDRDAWHRLGSGLLARWNEPHRSYHDERHLEDVLLALNHLEVRGERVMLVTHLAAWFHDAVYAGASGADEAASAALAHASLSDFGLGTALLQQTGELIVSTAPGRRLEDPTLPLIHLLDADLAIFASPGSRYREYASSVRREYAHVSDTDFAAGRAAILRGYLAQPTIYRTDAAHRLWEDRARANLIGEVDELHRTG